ncbi:NAD(P)-binding domain protein [Akanthomyces lecanii RCEF 1005]|uniref:NAD(P)-binding domain protein n=1 Tax=Akanthomyces lecanii RCEF 1005 TaxID=1081108 RepID=A0A162MZ70_CORDF|nr:NAD(P)-binding domain protein [Akanthomyces lecanii RCEF 1005]
MSSRRTIVVTGATGKQGGALIDALLKEPDAAGFNIVAVTRDATSSRAQKLASKFNISVASIDAGKPDVSFNKILSAAMPVWGVYSVQVNSEDEEAQGKALVNAAAAHGVEHFVYSSSDRGGPVKSPTNPTTVKNFAAKYQIEKHLEAAAAASSQKMTYTILRPVTFYDNLTNDMHGRGFGRMWEQMGTKKLQLVSTKDIGWFAAQAFMDPAKYKNAALTLVGDELSHTEAEAIFNKAVGKPMPLAPCPIASAVKYFLQDTVGDMFRWFEKEGYGGDVEECRKIYPEMQDFQCWISENKGRWAK